MSTAILEPPARSNAGVAPARTAPFKPEPPKTLTEAGISPETVDALIFKFLLTAGSNTGALIASTLKLPHALVVERLSDLKRQQLVTFVGAASMGDFTYQLSDSGRDRARRCMDENTYI